MEKKIDWKSLTNHFSDIIVAIVFALVCRICYLNTFQNAEAAAFILGASCAIALILEFATKGIIKYIPRILLSVYFLYQLISVIIEIFN